jgi:hypothetical protein
MRINYGISKTVCEPRKRKRILSRCGKLDAPYGWDDPRLHKHVVRRVHQQHPGWQLSGYCPAYPDKVKAAE